MEPSSLQSMCHVRASEIFPKVRLETEDESLVVPFTPICGESVEFIGHTSDGVLALSNYRLFLQLKDTYYNVPVGLIEQLEVRVEVQLHISCKDARSLRCTFNTNDQCLEWFRRLLKLTSSYKQMEDIFAFSFYAWSSESGGEETVARLRNYQTHKFFNFNDEVKRLRFDIHGAWRVSAANLEYNLCPSYPRQLLVPACISDEVLETVSRFRSSKRIPAVVWRHIGNGSVIARCSQPEVGWLGWRSSEDEDLLKAIADACAYDRGHSTMMDAGGSTDIDAIANGADDTESNITQGKKVLIMDARSYTTAVANRARGGGVECPEYYPSCDIQFMNLANIHSIRKSFHAVRQLCSTAADQPNWFSLLENTRWLQHMSGLLRAAITLVSAVEEEGRPVLVHCSDGWDRTSQIVSLAQLLLDPYYRTLNGFQVLVEREWLDFGHKFADRCGHNIGADDPNERCPVFLQFLDCVHQILLQFPCAFEFSQQYLTKLAQHTYSNLFGTFLGNSLQERQKYRISERTFSVWNFVRTANFRNHLFSGKDRVIWPSCKVRDLVIWCEVYLGAGETSITLSSLQETTSHNQLSPMNKTRSYNDLVAAQDHYDDSQRRSSDPNIASDSLNSSTDQGAGEEDDEEVVNLSVDDLSNITNQDASINFFNTSENCLDFSNSSEDILTVEENGLKASVDVFECTDIKPSLPEIESQPDLEEIEMEKKLVNGNSPLMKSYSEALSSSLKSSTEAAFTPYLNGENVEPQNVQNARVQQVLAAQSVESSTDTLTPDTVAKPVEVLEQVNGVNGKSVVANGLNGLVGDDCRVCASSRKFLAEKDKDGSGSSSSGKTSRYSTPPLFTGTPNEERPLCRYRSVVPSRLDEVDGLAPIHNDVQVRLHQIISDHKMKEEALQRDLHSTRLALIQQVCHHCSHSHERPDDTGSLPESVYSNDPVSVNESLPSDVSWEAIDDVGPTLWVPDHAVSHCMGCNTTFWIGRRRHHCRNCGKIFCSDCSDNTVPLPDEQLYNPVRVCTSCYILLNPPQTYLDFSADHNEANPYPDASHTYANGFSSHCCQQDCHEGVVTAVTT